MLSLRWQPLVAAAGRAAPARRMLRPAAPGRRRPPRDPASAARAGLRGAGRRLPRVPRGGLHPRRPPRAARAGAAAAHVEAVRARPRPGRRRPPLRAGRVGLGGALRRRGDDDRMRVMRALVNTAADPTQVPAPSTEARAFHEAMDGYRPTPVHDLPVARELGLGAVALKDESDRLGLPAFKVLGASWAVERALRERPDVRTLVAASAGQPRPRGRPRGRRCAACAARIFLPGARRRAGARRSRRRAPRWSSSTAPTRTRSPRPPRRRRSPAAIEIADIGDSGPARWVIDGYQTLFAEAAAQAAHDLMLVPVGVGSLPRPRPATAPRRGAAVVGVEPATAACLTASLAAGTPTAGRDAGHDHGRPRLRGGLDGGLADAAATASTAWSPSPTPRRTRRCASLASPRPHDRRLRRGDAGGARRARDGGRVRTAAGRGGHGTETRVLLVATEGASDPTATAAIVSGTG